MSAGSPSAAGSLGRMIDDHRPELAEYRAKLADVKEYL